MVDRNLHHIVRGLDGGRQDGHAQARRG
ncbi:Protein of unknown function [Propionibacterium freudenreichii]|nr:Protein of unknown function [Propionibacterium freudenreichii]